MSSQGIALVNTALAEKDISDGRLVQVVPQQLI